MKRNPYAPPTADVRDAADLAARPSPGHLFTPGQMALAAFLGSPMAAAWFMSSNYRALAQPLEAQRALLFGVAATLAAMVIAFMLPEGLPNTIFVIIYTVATHSLARSMFGNALAEHTAAGGALGSTWRVVGVSLLVLLAVLAVLFAVLLLLVVVGALPEDF